MKKNDKIRVAQSPETSKKLKKAEETLLFIRKAFESSGEAIGMSDPEGHHFYQNKAFTDLFEYMVEELEIVGGGPAVYVDQIVAREVFDKIMSGGAWNGEIEMISRSGRKFPVLLRADAIKDDHGRIVGLIGIHTDITERKRAEEALRESEEKYRTILENMEEGYSEVDLKGNFTFVNDAECKNLGYSREELIGMNNRQYTDEETAKKIYQTFNKIYRTGKPGKGIEEEYIRKDGVKGFAELSVSLMCDAKGKPIGFWGISRDITERKRAEEKLLKSEAKYRRLVEDAQEGLYQSTPKGRFLTLNPAFARMIGYDSSEEVMATITDIAQQLYVNPDDRKKLLEMVNEKGSVTDFETKYYKKDGSRIWVSINMHAVRDDQGRILYYQGINQDITEKKKMETERQENIERLRKSLGDTINAMAGTVETRDPYTAGHQRRVADLTRAIATEMNLTSDQINGVRMASMIHDIGKISIPSEILTKPTKLTDLEFNLIKTHSQAGYDILKDIEFPWPVANVVLQHHERMDGAGYPHGLKGNDILLEARILAIADVVEAMASHRPYRPALGIEVALEEIEKNKGILYDNTVADACLRLFREKNYQLQ
jgi:PAS domain S-box-containing protein